MAWWSRRTKPDYIGPPIEVDPDWKRATGFKARGDEISDALAWSRAMEKALSGLIDVVTERADAVSRSRVERKFGPQPASEPSAPLSAPEVYLSGPQATSDGAERLVSAWEYTVMGGARDPLLRPKAERFDLALWMLGAAYSVVLSGHASADVAVAVAQDAAARVGTTEQRWNDCLALAGEAADLARRIRAQGD